MSNANRLTAESGRAGAQTDAHAGGGLDDFEERYKARVAEIEEESGVKLSDYSKFLLQQAMWSAIDDIARGK